MAKSVDDSSYRDSGVLAKSSAAACEKGRGVTNQIVQQSLVPEQCPAVAAAHSLLLNNSAGGGLYQASSDE